MQTFSNANGWITVKNANLTGVSHTTSGGAETWTYCSGGLKQQFTTSDGTMKSLTAAGHFTITVHFDAAGNFLGYDHYAEIGKSADDAAICAAGIAVLS